VNWSCFAKSTSIRLSVTQTRIIITKFHQTNRIKPKQQQRHGNL
jgi:hypothetical protein